MADRAAGPLDYEVLDELVELARGQDDGFVVDLVERFLRGLSPRIEDMQRALREGDAPTLRLQAHDLTSSAGYLGAASLSRACSQLEVHCSRADLAAAAPTLQTVQDEAGRATKALRSWLEER